VISLHNDHGLRRVTVQRNFPSAHESRTRRTVLQSESSTSVMTSRPMFPRQTGWAGLMGRWLASSSRRGIFHSEFQRVKQRPLHHPN
jgi:hypothetical protein